MSISCSGITVCFGDHTVLDSVDLHARPGRVHALLGRNGAGKSTLMNVMLGLITPQAGTVELAGLPVGREALRKVGASVNGPAFYGHLSARDNLAVHAHLLGVGSDAIDRALFHAGLTDTGRKKAKSFSTGMKARLALAQALLADPEILILDEPQNGLDPQGIADLRQLLRGLAAAGRTVLVSSHQLGEVTHLADDATIIAATHVQYAGPLDGLAQHTGTDSLEEAFLQLTTEPALATQPTQPSNEAR